MFSIFASVPVPLLTTSCIMSSIMYAVERLNTCLRSLKSSDLSITLPFESTTLEKAWGVMYSPPFAMVPYAAAISTGVIPDVPSASPGPSALTRAASMPRFTRYCFDVAVVTCSKSVLAATMLSDDVTPRLIVTGPIHFSEPSAG